MIVLSLRTAAIVACAGVLMLPGPAVAGEGVGEYELELTGKQIPGKGDPKGISEAVLTVDPATEKVCWDMTWRHLAGRVTAMHLHSGASGKTGPHVVDLLDGVSLSGASAGSEGCAKAKAGGEHGAGLSGRDKLAKVLADPAHHYLNVHSTAYPHGAVRAQLG